MGEVYLAEDTSLRRKVALKLLAPEISNNPDRLLRFEQEAQASSALSHPNILVIHEIGMEGDVRFIATEYIEGETLRGRMSRGPLGVQEALDIAAQVAGALSAAHAPRPALSGPFAPHRRSALRQTATCWNTPDGKSGEGLKPTNDSARVYWNIPDVSVSMRRIATLCLRHWRGRSIDHLGGIGGISDCSHHARSSFTTSKEGHRVWGCIHAIMYQHRTPRRPPRSATSLRAESRIAQTD
jgi:hypothetical protein